MMWKNVVEPNMPRITHTHYEIPLVFNGNSGYANASQCYVIYTLPVLCMVLGTFSDYSIN
jgi:hypothetical protein